jgi:hypothetical protein
MQRLMGPQSRAGLAEAELPSAYAPTASDHYDQLSPLPASWPPRWTTSSGPLGALLWPPVASSAYAALLPSEGQSLYCSLTWDASPSRWAGLARWGSHAGPEPVLLDQLFEGSWLADWDVSEQPFREALGGALAFEAFAQAVDIRGLT